MTRTYDPSVFDVTGVDQAKRIILTPEDSTTEQRWTVETPYLTELAAREIAITRETVVLDYGTGIGRMAKALIDRHGCKVVGVDISPSMRQLALSYVASKRFSAATPADLATRGAFADVAIAIWVLQHCDDPAEDIKRIWRALKKGGWLFVVNNVRRVVPSVQRQTFTAIPTLIRQWLDDGVDVRSLLDRRFACVSDGPCDPALTGIRAEFVYWAVFRKS